MSLKLRRFLIICVVLYISFLGWFFYGMRVGAKEWRPSDIYTEVGNCPTTTTAAAPSADQVFDAKTAVPMKSVTARRRAKRKRRSSMPVAKSTLGRDRAKFAVTAVGEGLHTVSSGQFRSFGADGLMYQPMPQYLKRTNNQVATQLSVMYPYLPMPVDANSEASGQENTVVTPPLSLINSSSVR